MTRKRTRRKGKKAQTNASSKTYRGINFKSNLEVYMYKLLKGSKIPFSYEKRKFVIDSGFTSPNKSYERFMKGTGEFKDRGSGKNFNDTIYTPDFTPPKNRDLDWVIEVKGRTMPDFPRTWRLFKKWLLNNGHEDTILFMPRNQKECNITLELIKEIYEKQV